MSPDCKLEVRWERIRTTMERHRALLEHHGTLEVKRVGTSKVHVMRFLEGHLGQRVKRTIYVGVNPQLIKRARALLTEFREPRRWQAEAAAAADSLDAIVSRLRRRFHRRIRC